MNRRQRPSSAGATSCARWVSGAGLAAVAAAPLATEAAATESDAEKKKARYNPNSEDVKNFYRVNRLLGRGAASGRAHRDRKTNRHAGRRRNADQRRHRTARQRQPMARPCLAADRRFAACGAGARPSCWPKARAGRNTRAARSDLELFRGETEGYLTNLSQNPPVVYVVLRRNEDGEGLEFEPFLATVCPYEAMGYTTGGDEIVEGVPMPPEIVAWLREFVARHHVDEPFLKRKNKRHQDEYGGKRPRGEREKGLA